MKKISILLIVPIIIFWFFPMVARAENNANTSALIEYVYAKYGVTMLEARANTVCNTWEQKYDSSSSWHLFMMQEDSNYITFIHSNNYTLGNQNENGSYGSFGISGSWTSQIYRVDTQSISTNNGNSTLSWTNQNVYDLGDWGSFLINYDLYEYDPNIPDPHILIAYKENVRSNIPLVFQVDPNPDYYIECYARFYKGENYNVDQNGNFKVVSKYTSAITSVLSMQERITTTSFGGSMESNLNTPWTTVYTDHPYNLSGPSEYFEQSNTFDYLDDWLEAYDQNLVMCGNQVQLYFRFWKMEGNDIKVGRWSTWFSKVQNEFTVNVPSWLQPYGDAVGTHNQIVMPDPDLLPQLDPIGGTPTGGNTYITVNSNNVPNYPDYPTVVTYNHDNIFTQFIETAKQLPDFFGETTDMFSEMFGFIPTWIWGIIGFGFLANIVIMIVKVL